MTTPAEAWQVGVITGARTARADIGLDTLTNPYHVEHAPAGGAADVQWLSDMIERLNDTAGDVNLEDVSKQTRQDITNGRRATIAFVTSLRGAARQIANAHVRRVEDAQEARYDSQLEAAMDAHYDTEPAGDWHGAL